MTMHCGHDGKRMTALLLALCLIAFFCLSGAYCLANIHHKCTGEHCPICERIHLLLALADELGTAAVILLCVWTCGFPLTVLKQRAFFYRADSTPIQRFDRMNN
jgi:hypothetical protein